MEKQNLNLKINPQFNKINIKKPFKDIKFTGNQNQNQNINQNNIFINKDRDKNFHTKYLFKIKEKNNFNKTYFDKTSLPNKIGNDIFVKERKFNNLKKDINNDNKENQIQFNQNKLKFNNYKKIRCFSQEKIKLAPLPNNNILNNEEEDDINDNKDINVFFDNINKEFADIGKIIKINFILDEKRKYEFNKNEFVILKIIENELKEKYGLKIKEFIYNNQKLKVFKSLKENKLEDNCNIKIIIE